MQKKGVFIPRPRNADMAHSWRGTWDPRGCDAARKATWQGRAGPRQAQVAHKARTRGRRQHGPRERLWGVPCGRRVGKWRAHGLVGHGKMIGAVTQ